MSIKSFLISLLTFFLIGENVERSNALVVSQPCCYVFEHRGAMFGPELPVKSDSIFDYIPERPKILSDVKGPLKLTDVNNPALCKPANVANQHYHFEDSIALIPRGGCSFAEKVYVAQLLGAKAAVVFQAHDANDPSSGIISTTGNDDVIVMAEDSRYGSLVEIPSAFISYNSWQSILSIIKETSDSGKSVEDQYYEEVTTEEPSRSLNQIRVSDELHIEENANKLNDVDLDYEASYAKKMQNYRKLSADQVDVIDPSIYEEIGASESFLAEVRRDLTEKQIFVVLNETGSLPTTGPDALPMMWDSMLFLIKVFLIIWSVMGFAYVSNWVKLRYRRLKRQHVIRSLPCKKYKKLQFHSNEKGMKTEKKSKYEKVGQDEDIDLERNEAPKASESESDALLNRNNSDTEDASVTLEEYDPIQTQRQNSDLKLRSPKKNRHLSRDGSQDSDGRDSGSSSNSSSFLNSEAIECDNCVICLCEFDLEDFATVLPCKHIYHKDCIEPWLVNKSSLCPICKQSIFKNGESRSINEIDQSEREGEINEGFNDNEQRRGSVALSVGMFLVIVLSFTFIMVDDDNN